MSAFVQSGKARSKIVDALYTRVKKEIGSFTLDELIQASSLLSQSKSYIIEFFPLVEPYIEHKFASMTEYQLSQLITLYYSDTMPQRFPILDKLENTLMSTLRDFDTQLALELFYFYAKNRVASSNVVASFMRRFSSERYQELNCQQMVQLLVTVDMVGAEDQVKRQILQNIE